MGSDMKSLAGRRICIVPHTHGVGGMVSFRHKLEQGLALYGISVSTEPDRLDYDLLLVIGGTRHLGDLQAARQHGIPVVQRLDGMNWLHRKQWTGVRHFVRAEAANALLRTIRARYADHIVYQSEFSRAWWERKHGKTRVPSSIVHNGVDLQEYAPTEEDTRPRNVVRMLMVEGNLGGGYETGLEHALQLGTLLDERLPGRLELMVVGRVDPALQADMSRTTPFPIRWVGLVDRKDIPALDRSAHFLFAADLNPACPNAVIEAMACGLPVAAFATGALPELVQKESGVLVPYGGDPWRLDPADSESLADAVLALLAEQDRYRRGARLQAEAHFGLERMVEGYLRAFGWM